MPELPEVETIRRHLAPRLEGRRLDALVIHDPRWCAPLAPAELAGACEGRRLERLERRGKYLVAALEDAVYLLVHLRMTGTLLYDAAPAQPYRRVTLGLDDGHELAFCDPRRFGTGELALGRGALAAFFDARLGLEPLGDALTGPALRELARGRRAPIKAFLLDQRHVAGVGNIYADEALHRAGVHPLRPAGSLRPGQYAALAEAVKLALEAGLDAGGATIDDFPPPRRRRRRLSARVPRPPAPRRAVRRVRHHDREVRGRRPRDLRLRALPAAPARGAPLDRSRAAAAPQPHDQRGTGEHGRHEHDPGRAADRVPDDVRVLPEAPARTDQRAVPHRGAQRGQRCEARHGHLGEPRGDGDQRAHTRDQPPADDDPGAVAVEPGVGAVQVALAQPQHAAVAQEQRPAALPRQDVDQQRAEDGAEGRRGNGQRERELAPSDGHPREGQDDLGGDGRDDVLDEDQPGEAGVAPGVHDVVGQLGQRQRHGPEGANVG
jgi:formamidopyrimidine-DNA glycosylase